jgi:5,6-dimethylbenzimidazole synthase
MQPETNLVCAHSFDEADRNAVYRAIHTRRDVRGQFLPDPIDPELLYRLLGAAHHAPSVGFMQPWNFIVITSPEVKQAICTAFRLANEEARMMFGEVSRPLYSALKLEGICEAPVNICITCDRERGGPVVLGRTHDRDTDLYSTACAVQNLALAARAEGIGTGWVSVFKHNALRRILTIPDHVVPVAYLCLGHVREHYEKPELEVRGWRQRIPLEELIFHNRWGGS